MAILYMDQVNGNDANDGTSFANRFKTWSSGPIAARTAPGDTIRLMKTPEPTSLAQNASFTNNSTTVTLTTAVTANIDTCDSAWTNAMGANGTTTTTTTRKEGTNAARISPAAGFTTGMMAYKALGAATDFSAYQQISFWIKVSTGYTNANDITIRLCSDAAGVTTVDSYTIPVALGTSFLPIVYDKGSALGSSIQSVALDCNADRGAANIDIDNIIACKASSSDDSLTHLSLIGKNTAGEVWYPIKSINGTTILLDTGIAGNPAAVGGTYYGTTESVTVYKREAVNLYTNIVINEAGTAGNFITYSGGWDTTDMSTQTGYTFTSFFSPNTNTVRNYIKLTKLGIRGNGPNISAGSGSLIEDCYLFANNSTGGTGNVFINGQDSVTIKDSYLYSSASDGIGTSSAASFTAINCKIFGATLNGINNVATSSALAGKLSEISDCTIANNAGSGLVVAAIPQKIRVINTSFVNNTTADIGDGTELSNITLVNCLLSSSTEVSMDTANRASTNYILSIDHDQTPGLIKRFAENAVTVTDTTTRSVASGASWKTSITSTAISAASPMMLPIAQVLCAANKQMTIKADFRRDNTGLTGSLVCRPYQLTGLTSTASSSMSDVANTWETLTISFTPTMAGVVEITAEWYGGNSYNGWVHNIQIFQG